MKLNIWVRTLVPISMAILLGTLVFLLAQFREPPGFKWYGVAWFVGIICLIWESNWYVSRTLDQRIPWEGNLRKRILTQLLWCNLCGILLYDAAFVLLNWYENVILGNDNPLAWIHMAVATAIAIILVQIMSSIQIGYQVMEHWKEVEVRTEKHKKETALAKLEGVRQQIDPHFLFNNFGILESLIHESPQRASHYLEQLSDLYRILLRHLDAEWVRIEEELEFLTAYARLLKLRYGKAFSLEVDLDVGLQQKLVLPFAFQLLVENAIKHNAALPERPLKITIRSNDSSSVTVQNNRQKRTSVIVSNGLGLHNLSTRYRYRVGRDIEVRKTKESFTVILPIKG